MVETKASKTRLIEREVSAAGERRPEECEDSRSAAQYE
jgi:hypothetical protein